MKTYFELTTEQKEQVSIQFGGDVLLGREPAAFIYEIGISGSVICRRRIAQTVIECQGCHKSFRALSASEYRGGICPKCWKAQPAEARVGDL